MTNDSFAGSSTKVGTAGGFLTVLIVNLTQSDITRTIVLSLVGALVSFIVSLGLKKLVEWYRR